eukprot:TRINITY_DN48847_c0_g1_i2.p1 TRINITY_DN48847_c0_g1~~TRINITY_DN48847_c0_g1_i2.p1  ORF type:complete len:141 (-),score=31.48 TRINITY_DN48847_c0_g1_i2:10-432(-)
MEDLQEKFYQSISLDSDKNNYFHFNSLKQLILLLFQQTFACDNDSEKVQNLFYALDSDHNGCIDFDEFKQLEKFTKVNESQLEKLFQFITQFEPMQKIEFPNFFAAFVNRDSYFSQILSCLLYTSPSPRDRQKSRMPSSA